MLSISSLHRIMVSGAATEATTALTLGLGATPAHASTDQPLLASFSADDIPLPIPIEGSNKLPVEGISILPTYDEGSNLLPLE